MTRIEKVMTPMPHTIGMTLPIGEALDLMRRYRIRHIPVLESGKVVGILTDRDVKLAASFPGSSDLTVEDAMTPDPYCVRPDASLEDTTTAMLEHKYGCVLVTQENNRVVGIFTATDAIRVLADQLKERKRHAS